MTGSNIKSALVALVFSTGAASAATISIQDYSSSAYEAALSSFGGIVSEGFETSALGEVASGASLATAVGSFTTLGGTGTGGSVIGSGENVAVREGNVFGRTNTTAGGSRFLDSNDTFGISWTASTGSFFDRLVFVLSDVTDVGATLTLSVGDSTSILSGLANGNRKIVSVLFDEVVNSAELTFANTRKSIFATNDGFGIDDVAVNVAPAAVPLPAGFALLTGALGVLGAWRRRT